MCTAVSTREERLALQ